MLSAGATLQCAVGAKWVRVFADLGGRELIQKKKRGECEFVIEFEFNVRRVVKTLPFYLLMTTALVKPSLAACTSSPDNLTLNCSGPLSVGSGAPITVYDAAAAFQPVNGSNS